MRIILQRVAEAGVWADGETVGSIGRGLLALVGVERGDTAAKAARAADKVAGLRIFSGEDGRTQLDLTAIGGAVLVVSQFTLAADLARGRRPSFTRAAPPEEAEPLVEAFARGLEEYGLPVARGRFGAAMQVSLVNDGPFTLVLDL